MSILYQALSRAARENAQRGGTSATGAEQADVRPAAAAGGKRNFTSLTLRARPREGGTKRTGMIALIVVAVVGAGGWLYLSTLPPYVDPVGDLLAMVGLGPDPQPTYVADDTTFEQVVEPAVDGLAVDDVETSPEDSLARPLPLLLRWGALHFADA